VKGIRVASVLGTICAVVVLVGCSTTGQPQPANPAIISTSTSSAASGGAPAVSHPLSAAAILMSPCSALTAGQLSALGVGGAPSTNNTDPSGPGCAWMAKSFLSVNVGWIPANRNGLSDLYQKQQSMAYWRPTQIDGYPAVFADAAPQLNGGCLLNTGVNDHLYFLAGAQSASSDDQACVLARQVAADVIKNLGGN
jgi:hypothetical protein